jgi:site-specific DNA-methyltransferase (adenine-specific)
MNELTKLESKKFQECEQIIERGLGTFYEVGTALLAIRDERLYRVTHGTFEEYCRDRWRMVASRARQLIGAAQVVANLESVTIVTPDNESQARELAPLEPDAQREVWKKVVETAPNGNYTAAQIRAIVNEREIMKAAHEIRSEQREERRQKRIAEHQEIASGADNDNCRLVHADIAQYAEHIPDQSIDIIITDPPYSREYIPLYETLALMAARTLKQGGQLLVMTGKMHLPEVLALMTPHIRYHWTLSYLTPGGQAAQTWPRKVINYWKPILWFANGDYCGDWVSDVCKSSTNDNDKRFHKWGQSESGMADLIEKFTYPGQLICDPFLGGGTTGVVAMKLGRRFIGLDIKKETIDIARQRIFESING